MGTDRGLNRFDPRQNKWSYYTTQDGLPGAVVRGILEDESGLLWLSTKRRLARFAPRTEPFTAFGLHDGVQANQFHPGACFRNADGRMYFGGINGFNAFRPDEIRENSYVHPLVWTAFYRNGQEVKLRASMLSSQPLKLSSQFDLYEFKFASLCYVMPSLKRIR